MNEHVYMMIFGSSDGSDTRDMIVVERLPDGRYRASDILAKMGACASSLAWLRSYSTVESFRTKWLRAPANWRNWALCMLGRPARFDRVDPTPAQVERLLFDLAKKRGWIK